MTKENIQDPRFILKDIAWKKYIIPSWEKARNFWKRECMGIMM